MAREITKAQQQAVARYEAANYDKVLLRMPKGKRDTIRAAAEAGGATLNGFIMAAVDAALSGEQIAIEQGGQGLQLDAEHLAKAQSAAEAAGEDPAAWLARAVNDTADRDRLVRMMKR